MRSKLSLCLFCTVSAFLFVASTAHAQAPVFDTPVYAQKDGRDVVLEWDPATGADGYYIYRYEDVPLPPPPRIPLATVTGLTYRDVGAVDSPPDRYYYLVSAFNVDGETPAPNLAFKLNIRLHWVLGKWNVNLVSLPYFFIPGGRGVQAKSADLCDAVEPPSAIASVQRVVYGGYCEIDSNPCSQNPVLNFDLEPGVAYGVVPRQDNATLDIVGSHDPDYHPGGAKSIPLNSWEDCRCEFNLISVPYHSKAATAEDICTELGLTAPDYVARVPRELDDAYLHVCSSPYHNFTLVRGEALILRAHADQWQPDVYP
jgi:hypothetical protein